MVATKGNKRRRLIRSPRAAKKDTQWQIAEKLRFFNTHHKNMKTWVKVAVRFLDMCRYFRHKCTINCIKVRHIMTHSRTCRIKLCELCRRRELLFLAHMKRCNMAHNSCSMCKEYAEIISEHRQECKDTKTHKICKVCKWRRFMQKEHSEWCDTLTCKAKYCIKRSMPEYCQVITKV